MDNFHNLISVLCERIELLVPWIQDSRIPDEDLDQRIPLLD